MRIYKITEASAYLGVSINTLKTLANNDLDALCYWEERECSVLQCLQGIQGMRNKEEAMNNALELFQKNQEEK